MRSTQERRKGKYAKALLPSVSADLKKYNEIYLKFCQEGYTRTLAEMYAETFINEHKKPLPIDIVQAAELFDKIHDLSTAEFYLNMLDEKKMTIEEHFYYSIESLKTKSKLGHWRDAEDFRTEHINLMQKYSVKADMRENADLYISLALTDCAAKKYTSAFRMLSSFGYKPQGANDTKLLEILITGVYICSKSGIKEGLEGAVNNAKSCLKLFNNFEFKWSEEYYKKCIEEATQGIL